MAMFERYLHPRLIAVLLLGFSSGLPRLLVAGTLGAWLLESGVDMAAIGLFAYVALPYTIRFLWAPLADHWRVPLLHRLGRRRGWMILTQGLLIAALLGLAATDPAAAPLAFAAFALAVSAVSATQDTVIDAFRTEYLDSEQYALGAAMAVFGYRVGMLAAGAGALALADVVSWPDVYRAMAGLVGVGMLTALAVREPTPVAEEENGESLIATEKSLMKRAVVAPFADFARRYPHWLTILVFITFYRMPDGFIAFMSTPFLLDIGFSKTELAAIGKVFGFAATTLGMFIGGALVPRLGMRRSLFWFGLFQILANLVYIAQAWVGPERWMLMVTISADNLSAGMAMSVAIAYMMTLCNPAFTATQYALLASLAATGSTLLSGSAGWVADVHGWPVMFALSALLGLPAMAILLSGRALEQPAEAIVTKA